jgi:hypothetical protein
LALVSPKSTSRFELRENFTTLNLLSVVHSNCQCLECDKSTIAQGFFCADSPEWCVPLSTLTVSVGSRGNMAFAPAKKCAISDRALQVQRLPSHVLQSISSIESLALWLFEILQICVLRLELFCSATKLAPLPRVQCRHAWLLWHLLISLPIRIPKARLKNQIRSGWRSRPAYCFLLVLFAFFQK